MRRLMASMLFLLIAAAATAGPGDGIQIGNLVINPFIEGTYTTDSNINLDPTNQVDDAFLEGIGGIQFHYEREWFVLEGRLFSQLRRYEESVERDFNDWGERMAFRCGNRDVFSILVDQSMRSVTDYDRSTYFGGTLSPEAQNLSLTYDRSTRVERTLHDAGMVIGRSFGDKFELDVGVGTSWEDYQTNALFDISHVSVEGEVGWKATEKMSFMLTGGMREEKNDSYDGKATATTIRLGVKRRASDKMQLRLGVGADYFSRPAEINDFGREVQARSGGTRGINEGQRTDEQSFSFELSSTWVATDKITVEVAGHNAIQSTPQYPNTLDLITVGSMNIVYDFSDTITVSLTGSYRKDDYLDPVVELGEEQIRLDERLAGLARIDYVPPRQFLTIFVEGGYEQSESTIYYYNYDQLRLGGGISIRY